MMSDDETTVADTAVSDLLAGYMTRLECARELGISARAVDGYRNQPDGLPWVKVGRTVYIPRTGARAWIQRREVHPSPTRVTRRKPIGA